VWSSLLNDAPPKIIVAFWTEVHAMHRAKSASAVCGESSGAQRPRWFGCPRTAGVMQPCCHWDCKPLVSKGCWLKPWYVN